MADVAGQARYGSCTHEPYRATGEGEPPGEPGLIPGEARALSFRAKFALQVCPSGVNMSLATGQE